MGQNASRSRRTDAAPAIIVSPPDPGVPDTTPHDEATSGISTTSRRSRRSSIRKSLMSMVSPSSSNPNPVRGRADSTVSSASTASRRPWRTRRWSKQRTDLVEPSTEIVQENLPPQPESIIEDSESSSSLAQVLGKGKEKELDRDDDKSDRPSTPFPVDSPSDASSSRPSATRETNGWGTQGHLAHRLGISTDSSASDDEVVIAPASRPDTPAVGADAHTEPIPITAHDRPPSPAAPPPPTIPPARPFPPAGTLVVVQGVVHTTDVPRPPDAPVTRGRESHPPTATSSHTNLAPPSGVRRASSAHSFNGLNRLSALIGRPASVRSSRPASSAGHNTNPAPSPISTDFSSATQTSLTPDSDGSTRQGDATPNANPADVQPAVAEEAQRPGTLSPSSIDVLGTLLSVAAAATAASLLTGSSEPIFAPHPTPDLTTAANPPLSPNAQRPMSPTPTAGLGGYGFPGIHLGGGEEPTQAQAHRSRERVSRAWSSLRERLGLRSEGRLRPDGTPINTRENMLAEMARAFNLGLGLNDTGNGAADAQDGDAGWLPPEDSFERFLMNIQTELRTVLTGSQEGPARDSAPAPALPSDEVLEAAQADVSRASEEEEEYVGGDLFQEDSRSSDDEDEMPALQDNSDSESDSDTEDMHAYTLNDDSRNEEQEIPSEAPPPMYSQPSEAAGSTSQAERRPAGGINWWRLYRFPSIAAPPMQGGVPLNTNTSAMPSEPPTVPVQPQHISEPTDPSSLVEPPASPAADSEAPSPTTPDSPMPNSVVPVIIVGLRSVAMGRQPTEPSTLGGVPQDAFPGDGPDFGEEDMGVEPVNEDTNNGRRGRTWPSRAANAIRNWRPGRRATSRGAQTQEGPGSRTFLIYVIGGYYPPDHHILNGGTDMNSFEALWELADLFGNHKPPTASKEDIEKSGLEIIKPADLEQYEKDGKISSNCTDRCLICLDDYDPEDELRLLACRHGFHKSCVDKWLETGRNNCPACRSTGVSAAAVS